MGGTKTGADEVNTALYAYLRVAANEHEPDERAYQGGLLVRELLTQLEEFFQVNGIEPESMQILAVEALSIYACCSQEEIRVLPRVPA